MVRSMVRRFLVGIVVLAACRTERMVPGEAKAPPPPGARAADEAAILTALNTYYDRLSRRSWREFRTSFWPGAIIAVRWHAPADVRPTVHIQTLDQFLAETKNGPDRLAVFEEQMVHHEVRAYGDLAAVWATFRATFGWPGQTPTTHFGVDAFQLLKGQGEWRIVSLAFTEELPGDSLPKDR